MSLARPRHLAASALALAGCGYTGKSIDAHAHFESGPAAGRIQPNVSGRPDVLLGDMDRAGVDRAVLLVVPPSPDLAAVRELHDRVAALLRAHPGRFLAVGAVQPSDGEPGLRELERIAALGYRGVKLSPSKLELETRPRCRPSSPGPPRSSSWSTSRGGGRERRTRRGSSPSPSPRAASC